MDKAKEEIIKILKKELKLKEVSLEIPPDSALGDYAFPCFQLAKEFKKNPIEIAKELAKKLKPNKIIKEIKEIGPYLNFFVNKQALAGSIIREVLEQKEKYGEGTSKKEKAMVEFSQPNTHKAFHVGHLRNVCIGDALVKIMRFAGYPVIAANYINDTGAHVAKCIWYYLKYEKSNEPKEKKGEWLGKIYAQAADILEKQPELKEEVDELHKKIEENDPELMKVWETTRQWSLDDFNYIYKELDVKFDTWFYDNELTEPGKKAVHELLKKKIAVVDDGAAIVHLEKQGLGVALILKKDGTTLYITKDLALAKEKFNNFKIDKSIYVVASEQSLHFKQLFKILELYGFRQAKKCHHLSYELVMLKEGKMSSREGNIILYSTLAKEIKRSLLKEVSQRHKDWTEKQKKEAIENIASAALKFGMINHEHNKVIVFDIEKALDFEGETGPYIQYAHARICSILKKYGKKPDINFNPEVLKEPRDEKLISTLSKFPEKITESAENYKPYILSRYLLALAQSFNEFYHACPVLQADEDTRKARLALASAVKQVIETGLGLLGIKAPEEM